MSREERPFFVAGGTLRPDAPSYVERRADRELVDALRAGEFCYILTSRQMGKSSLMVRAAARLRQDGLRAAVLDLSSLGQNLSPEQWYEGLAVQLAMRLGLEAELEEYWRAHAQRAPLQRFMGALRDVALPGCGVQGSGFRVQAQPPTPTHPHTHTPTHPHLVLFLDEIDAVRSLPFSTDEFFAAIRECYNRRPEDPCFDRLTFCLLGVAAPTDLIRDPRTTPFNIGRRIELGDFTEEEALPLALGLLRSANDEGRVSNEESPGEGRTPRALSVTRHSTLDTRTAEDLLRRILYWTGGHPYLTQRLCQAVAGFRVQGSGFREGAPPNPEPQTLNPEIVDRLCHELFLSRGARERDNNLIFVRERLLRGEVDRAAVLDVYARVLNGRSVPEDETDPVVTTLRLSGVVGPRRRGRAGFRRSASGTRPAALEVRNRIYARVFDREWVRENLPDAEFQRQRAAYRRGLLRAGMVAGLVLVAVTGLAITAVTQAGAARAQARSAAAYAGRWRQTAARLESVLAEKQAALNAKQTVLTKLRKTLIERDEQTGRARRLAREAASSSRLAQAKAAEASHSAAAARTAQQTAVARGDESNERLARLAVTHGLRMVDDGDLYGSLLRFTQALSIEQKHPERQEIHRRRIGALLAGAPRLVRQWSGTRIAELSPDGRRILTVSGGRARLWDGLTGNPVASPLHEGGGFTRGHFSPDGRRAALIREDGAVRILDASTGPPQVLIRLPTPAGDCLFSPDGHALLTLGGDTARVWNPATGAPVTPPMRHAEFAGGVYPSFSSDGRRIAILGGDYTGWIWDAATGERLTRLFEGPTGVYRLTFSPDGRHVAGEVLWGEARVWDTMTGRPVTPLLKLGPPPSSSAAPLSSGPGLAALRFSPDGTRLLMAADRAGCVRVFNARTGEPLTPLLRHRAAITDVHFSPDGSRFVSGSYDGTARVWDASTGMPVTPPLVVSDPVAYASFTRDGRRVVTTSRRNLLRVWDASTGEPVTPFLPSGVQPNYDQFERTRISHDGSRLLALERSGIVRLWDLTPSGAPALRVKPAGGASCAAFSPDSRRLATGMNSGLVEVRDLASGRVAGPLLAHPARVGTVIFSPDGQRLLTTSGIQARVWDAARGALISTLGHAGQVWEACFSPDGRRVATASDRNAVLWDAAAGRQIRVLRGHTGKVRRVMFSRDGARLLTGSEDQTARVWEVPRGRLLAVFRHGGELTSAALSADGRLAFTSSKDSTVRVWDVASGRAVLLLRHASEVHDAAFSPDGRRIATAAGGANNAYASAEAVIWDTRTGRRLGPALRQAGTLRTVAFSPDGRYLATGTFSGVARVWDAVTGEPLTPPLPHDSYLWETSFSPDGRHLLTAAGDGAVRVWNLPGAGGSPQELTRLAELLSTRRLEAGGEIALTSSELGRAWDGVPAARRGECVPPCQAATWHEQEARVCEQAGQWALAAMHLERLLETGPPNAGWRRRLGRARLLAAFEGQLPAGTAREAIRDLSSQALSDTPGGALLVLANHDPVQLNAHNDRPLRIGATEYRRGLYCHADSRVLVALPAPARRFRAVCGIDSNEMTRPGRGSVHFAVRVGPQERFRSSLFREGMPGVPLSVELRGARALTLVVEDGADGIECDQANWADARVELEDGRVLWLGDLPLRTAEDP